MSENLKFASVLTLLVGMIFAIFGGMRSCVMHQDRLRYVSECASEGKQPVAACAEAMRSAR